MEIRDKKEIEEETGEISILDEMSENIQMKTRKARKIQVNWLDPNNKRKSKAKDPT